MQLGLDCLAYHQSLKDSDLRHFLLNLQHVATMIYRAAEQVSLGNEETPLASALVKSYEQLH